MLSPIAIHSRQKGAGTSRDEGLVVSRGFYLGNLGKPTLRGVRKCDKCGTLNGTRGIRCKNQTCDQVFKAGEKKKPTGPEAVKLITDPGIQVYSVRSRTADNRGFVQLPIVQDLDGNPAVVDVGIVCSAAKCYVDTCNRSKNEAAEPCFHIQSSVEALEEAAPLTFKNSVLNSMAISSEMRQQIWHLATDKAGPLVQRVTKQIMAVKTPVTMRHPLGYLHFTFMPSKKEEKRFICTCKEAKFTKVTMSEPDANGECSYRVQRCLHFYACVCAFASDEALSTEFKYAIDADIQSDKSRPLKPLADGTLIGVKSDEDPGVVELEAVAEETTAVEKEDEEDVQEEEEQTPVEVIIQSSSTQPGIDYTYRSPTKQLTLTTAPPDSKRFKPNSVLLPHQPVQSGQTYQSFLHWLHTVTERINLTMHYSLPGNPKPLVFYIPQAFWDCFVDRISNSVVNKRLLPNNTCTIIRTSVPPLGTFNQYSWYLTELAHVRKVFDTGEVALLVSKYYDRAADGTYTLSATPRVQVEPTAACLDRGATSTTKQEYKTFLRVGQQGNQGLIPFVIDWIPDLLPITRTGELTLTFQYSHTIDGLSPAVDDDLVHHVIEGSATDTLTIMSAHA